MLILSKDLELQHGDLFNIVLQLREGREYPKDPASFREGEDITCMFEEELGGRMKSHLGFEAETILGMALRPHTYHDWVLLAHLAILRANQLSAASPPPPPLEGSGADQGDQGGDDKSTQGGGRKRPLPVSLKQGEAKKKVCLSWLSVWFF